MLVIFEHQDDGIQPLAGRLYLHQCSRGKVFFLDPDEQGVYRDDSLNQRPGEVVDMFRKGGVDGFGGICTKKGKDAPYEDEANCPPPCV